MITSAKGLTSGYSPLGAVICRDFLAEPFIGAEPNSFVHGLTFGGHPVSCAVALENLAIFEDEDVLGNVARHEAGLPRAARGPVRHPDRRRRARRRATSGPSSS